MASILFLSTMNGGPWGGSEELWSRTAALLAREGHDVGCAAFGWPEKAARLDALRASGCRVWALPNWRRRKLRALDRLVHEALAKPAQVVAVRRLPWRRFEHVVVSQGAWDEITTQPFRALDRRARGYSLVYHSYSEHALPRRPELLRRLVLAARRNLFAAARIREVFAGRLGVDPPGAQVFHNPLTIPIPAEPLPWIDPGGPLRLAALGSLDIDTKAHDVLLDALAAERWRGRQWRLDVYGEGRDRPRIEALVREKGLNGKVALRGHTADVAAALGAAHLVVQASRVEAMPIVVHEAMATARPCLVTRVGDMDRWIRDGETGFVAGRPVAEEVGRALEAAWAARERLPEMGRAARRDLLARFPRDPVREFADIVVSAASADRRP